MPLSELNHRSFFHLHLLPKETLSCHIHEHTHPRLFPFAQGNDATANSINVSPQKRCYTRMPLMWFWPMGCLKNKIWDKDKEHPYFTTISQRLRSCNHFSTEMKKKSITFFHGKPFPSFDANAFQWGKAQKKRSLIFHEKSFPIWCSDVYEKWQSKDFRFSENYTNAALFSCSNAIIAQGHICVASAKTDVLFLNKKNRNSTKKHTIFPFFRF